MIDRYRLFWQGKSPRVRTAVEDYLGSGVSVREAAEKQGVSIVSIINRSKQLKYLYHKGVINLPEILYSVSLKEKGLNDEGKHQ